ncbi:unnamed protein product [Pleuronectes platessa]|uniref:Uncharacterized protein n=1 Tax=Pleuronectes platessa TaxID=8262 RepID=A0A9N7VAS2_PLEPL|nr:unnamed protein product [Pleuronectes platessa]
MLFGRRISDLLNKETRYNRRVREIEAERARRRSGRRSAGRDEMGKESDSDKFLQLEHGDTSVLLQYSANLPQRSQSKDPNVCRASCKSNILPLQDTDHEEESSCCFKPAETLRVYHRSVVFSRLPLGDVQTRPSPIAQVLAVARSMMKEPPCSRKDPPPAAAALGLLEENVEGPGGVLAPASGRAQSLNRQAPARRHLHLLTLKASSLSGPRFTAQRSKKNREPIQSTCNVLPQST